MRHPTTRPTARPSSAGLAVIVMFVVAACSAGPGAEAEAADPADLVTGGLRSSVTVGAETTTEVTPTTVAQVVEDAPGAVAQPQAPEPVDLDALGAGLAGIDQEIAELDRALAAADEALNTQE